MDAGDDDCIVVTSQPYGNHNGSFKKKKKNFKKKVQFRNTKTENMKSSLSTGGSFNKLYELIQMSMLGRFM